MKIVLACGGTGGHIFPAFSLAEELRARDPEGSVIYVCGNKDIESQIFGIVAHERVVSMDSAPLSRKGALAKPSFLLRLLKGFVQAMRFLRSEKPDVVVGFGGHFSFPVVVSAKILGIPTVIHEQNVKPGAANRVLSHLADAVAVSYPETVPLLPSRRTVCTGNPIRSSIETASKQEGLAYFGFSSDKRTLLVLGGSQGAGALNTMLLEALPGFSERFKREVQILHLCGKMPVSESEAAFRKEGMEGRAYSFFDRMDMAYAAADFAVGRAGATFLAEIASKRVPALLVPYPFGDGHQRENARIYAMSHPARVIEQKELTAQVFKEVLTSFLDGSMGGMTAQTEPVNARKVLAELVQSYVK